MIREIKCVTALDAEEISVGSTLVAIVAAHDLHPSVGASHAQRGLASIAAVRADAADVLHLPRPRLVAIRAGGERTHRADVDAHPALFALQMILFIRSDNRTHAAVLHPE